MPHDILINWSPYETRVGIIENASVQELHFERAKDRGGYVGNIYLGKVMRVLPGMQSAFIDIGLERTGFLHVADLCKTHTEANAEQKNAPLPIEHLIFEGQTVMVQVIKGPIGTKGARLTTQISIAGGRLVFFPKDQHIGVSQKIPASQRDALRERLLRLVDQKDGGFILRTNAEDASDQELLDDIIYLRKIWRSVKEASLKLPPTSVIYQELTLPLRVLRDLVCEDTQSIRIDSREQWANLRNFSEWCMPHILEKLALYEGDRPIFDLFDVDLEIKAALSERVQLKSGGYLIIDQTEALTTIDVNTGAFTGNRNFDDTIYKTNLEAARAIARQLRLRNLGGIIILDFIDMTQEDHRQSVWNELSKQLQKDRVKTTISAFSSLGLIELTRKRTRDSLSHTLCEPCPHCHGNGQIKTAATIVYEILREVLREARQFHPKEIRIIANSTVVDLLLDEESEHLAILAEFIGIPVKLQSERGLTAEQYDIVLL